MQLRRIVGLVVGVGLISPVCFAKSNWVSEVLFRNAKIQFLTSPAEPEGHPTEVRIVQAGSSKLEVVARDRVHFYPVAHPINDKGFQFAITEYLQSPCVPILLEHAFLLVCEKEGQLKSYFIPKAVTYDTVEYPYQHRYIPALGERGFYLLSTREEKRETIIFRVSDGKFLRMEDEASDLVDKVNIGDVAGKTYLNLSGGSSFNLSDFSVVADPQQLPRSALSAEEWLKFNQGKPKTKKTRAKTVIDSSKKLHLPKDVGRVVEFQNIGTKILFVSEPQSQVFIKPPRKPKRLLTGGRLLWAPIAEGASTDPTTVDSKNFYALEKEDPLAPVVTTEGVFLILSDGTDVQIPAQLPCLFGKDPTGFSLDYHQLTHGGKELILISLRYPEKPPETHATGETYLYSLSDHILLKVDQYWHDLDQANAYSVQNGILSISGSPRQIDLERLRGEERTKVLPPNRVVDPEGKEIKDLQLELKKTFRNLTQEMAQDPKGVFDHRDLGEVERKVRIALARTETGSVALIGDAGVGKTEFVRALVGGIVAGRFPELPRTTQVIAVDVGSLQQGTEYTGQFETRVNLLLQACKEIPCLLFLDEMHSLRGAGTHSRKSSDFFEMLKTSLGNGSIRVIGTSTAGEYDEAFAGDLALVRRFTRVEQPEPSIEKVPGYLERWVRRFQKPIPSKSVLDLVGRLASDFNAIGANPAKSKDLLEHAYAEMEVSGRFDEAPTGKDIRTAAQDLYSLNSEYFKTRSQKKLFVSAPDVIERYVIGQKWAKAALYRLLKDKLAQTQDPQRPGIRLLLAGPPGVGKTELGLALAKALQVPAARIEMNKYAEGGVNEFRRELTQAVRKNSHGVIILDEIEKAHPAVQTALLAVLDCGMMEVRENLNSSMGNSGQVIKVNFRHSSFIATTNAGQNSIFKPKSLEITGFRPAVVDEANTGALDREQFRRSLIADGIADTVLDRFQQIAPVFPPTREEFRPIVELHLDRALEEQSIRQGIEIQLVNRNEFLDFAVERYYRPGMSNRVAHEITQFVVRSQVADQKFASTIGKGEVLKLRFDRDAYLRAVNFQGGACRELLVRAS